MQRQTLMKSLESLSEKDKQLILKDLVIDLMACLGNRVGDFNPPLYHFGYDTKITQDKRIQNYIDLLKNVNRLMQRGREYIQRDQVDERPSIVIDEAFLNDTINKLVDARDAIINWLLSTPDDLQFKSYINNFVYCLDLAIQVLNGNHTIQNLELRSKVEPTPAKISEEDISRCLKNLKNIKQYLIKIENGQFREGLHKIIFAFQVDHEDYANHKDKIKSEIYSETFELIEQYPRAEYKKIIDAYKKIERKFVKNKLELEELFEPIYLAIHVQSQIKDTGTSSELSDQIKKALFDFEKLLTRKLGYSFFFLWSIDGGFDDLDRVMSRLLNNLSYAYCYLKDGGESKLFPDPMSAINGMDELFKKDLNQEIMKSFERVNPKVYAEFKRGAKLSDILYRNRKNKILETLLEIKSDVKQIPVTKKVTFFGAEPELKEIFNEVNDTARLVMGKSQF